MFVFSALRVGDRAFMVGSLDSNKMIFGIKESNSFPVRDFIFIASFDRYVEVGMFWILVFSHCFFFDTKIPSYRSDWWTPGGGIFRQFHLLFCWAQLNQIGEKKAKLFQLKKDSENQILNQKNAFVSPYIHPSSIRTNMLCFIIKRPSMDSFW